MNDRHWIGAPVSGRLTPAAPTGRARRGPGAVTDDLTGLLTELADGLPASVAARMPVFLAATEFGARETSRFVAACSPGVRLRPSASLALEASRLVAPFAAASGWSGRCHLLMSTADAAGQALRAGYAAVARGAPVAAVAEITVDPDGDGYRGTACLIGGTAGHLPARRRPLAAAGLTADDGLALFWHSLDEGEL